MVTEQTTDTTDTETGDIEPGFTMRRLTSPTGRGFVRVVAPDGRKVSFYDEGDLRLYKKGHIVELRGANPESVYAHFIPR